MAEGIRTLAVGEFVPNSQKNRHCRRRNEPPVGSLPVNLAAAAVNEMFSSAGVVRTPRVRHCVSEARSGRLQNKETGSSAALLRRTPGNVAARQPHRPHPGEHCVHGSRDYLDFSRAPSTVYRSRSRRRRGPTLRTRPAADRPSFRSDGRVSATFRRSGDALSRDCRNWRHTHILGVAT